MPPLRERGQDVVLLAEYFVKKYCQQFGLTAKTLLASAANTLVAHAWPGNIRELENVIQKAILLSPDDRISKDNLQLSTTSAFTGGTLKEARSIAEKEIISRTLTRTKGNVSMASKLLDIDRKWLMKLMEESGIDADTYRS
jgi:DNA-binding NtrC family response regulator